MIVLKFIYTVLFWLGVTTVFFLHYLVCTIVMLLPINNKQAHCYDLAIPFIRYPLMLFGISLTISGIENIPKQSNVLIIANHQSLLDVVILIVLMPIRITFFAKRELAKVPLLSADIRRMGHIFVDRDAAKKARQQLKIVETKLIEGKNIIIFPEGTRSIDGTIAPLKRGAFLMAANTRKPILPCYIQGTGNILNKRSLLLSPGSIHVHIAPTLVTQDDTQDPKDLSKQLQKKGTEALLNLQKKSKNN